MAIPDPATTNWVPIWNPISTGPVGPPGPVGPVGPSSSVMKYRADTTSVSMASDPGTGKIRWNNATQNLSTILSFDRLTDDGFDATLILSLTNSQDEFAIQDQDLATGYQVWRQTGPATIVAGDWFTVPVVFVSQAGSSTFNNNQRLAILTKATGSQGPVGPIGPAGPVGPQGPTGSTGPSGATAPHHVTHETSGSDAIVALSGGVITSGTVADTRLSSNVALKNIDNSLVSQTFRSTSGVVELDLDEALNAILLRLINYQGKFQLYYNPVGALFTVDTAGNTVALGDVKGNTAHITGGITSGPITSGSISSNSTITAGDVIIGNSAIRSLGPIESRGNNGVIYSIDQNGPVNSRIWRIIQFNNGIFNLEATDDAVNVKIRPITINQSGVITFPSNYTQHDAGIYLPALSSNGALLDKYEEGSWIPILISTAGGAGTAYNAQGGSYTRIGDFVILMFNVNVQAANWTSGLVNIGGFPFVNANAIAVGHLDYYNITRNIVHMQIHLTPSANSAYFPIIINTSTSPHQDYVAVTDVAPGTVFRGTIVYKVG